MYFVQTLSSQAYTNDGATAYLGKASVGKEAQLALVGVFEGHGMTKMVGLVGMMEAILHSIVERNTGQK